MCCDRNPRLCTLIFINDQFFLKNQTWPVVSRQRSFSFFFFSSPPHFFFCGHISHCALYTQMNPLCVRTRSSSDTHMGGWGGAGTGAPNKNWTRRAFLHCLVKCGVSAPHRSWAETKPLHGTIVCIVFFHTAVVVKKQKKKNAPADREPSLN